MSNIFCMGFFLLFFLEKLIKKFLKWLIIWKCVSPSAVRASIMFWLLVIKSFSLERFSQSNKVSKLPRPKIVGRCARLWYASHIMQCWQSPSPIATMTTTTTHIAHRPKCLRSNTSQNLRFDKDDIDTSNNYYVAIYGESIIFIVEGGDATQTEARPQTRPPKVSSMAAPEAATLWIIIAAALPSLMSFDEPISSIDTCLRSAHALLRLTCVDIDVYKIPNARTAAVADYNGYIDVASSRYE